MHCVPMIRCRLMDLGYDLHWHLSPPFHPPRWVKRLLAAGLGHFLSPLLVRLR